MRANLVYGDSLHKPLYFTLASESSKPELMMQRLNEVYSQASLAQTHSIRLADVEVDSYVAALSEDNWYRVRVKRVEPDQSSCRVYFVDFGYEDVIGADEFAKRVRRLDEQLHDEPRLAFGVLLASAGDPGLPIDVKGVDPKCIEPVLTKFFVVNTNKDDEALTLNIVGSFGSGMRFDFVLDLRGVVTFWSF